MNAVICCLALLFLAGEEPQDRQPRHLDGHEGQHPQQVPQVHDRAQHHETAHQQRGGADWYLGAITNDDRRVLSVPLDFLTKGRRYEAQIYADAPDADWRTAPERYRISSRIVTADDAMTIDLASGGGQAIRFRAL